MKKTVLSEIDGFTVVPDLLVNRYSLITAAVWGVMWRFCQMENHVCQAALETIGERLGIDRSTVMRHIENLVADGWMEDKTPGLRNRPHTYADTGKLTMYNRWGMSVAQNNTDLPTVAQNNKSVAQNNTGVAENLLKKDSKRVSKKKVLGSEEVQKIVEAANKEVDEILRLSGLAAGRSWTKLPEIYHPFGKVFCAATGLTYTKSDLYKWMPVFDTWSTKNHTPKMVLDAIEELKSEGKAGTISGPSSITWKLEAMAVRRHTLEEKAIEPSPIPELPPQWKKHYERVA